MATQSGPSSGSSFSEGDHRIRYTATDRAGNTARCDVTFTIVRIRCPSIGSASYRSYSCSNSRYVYSRCSFSCSTGYYVSGSSSVTCQSSGHWSGSFPYCRIRTCSSPPTPSHGSRSCSSYNYGATCHFQCDSGYTLSGSSSRTCQGSSWSGSTPSCADTQPPSFGTCPSNMNVNNDDRSMSAVVTYVTPTASDNSGSSPSINKQQGQDSGTSFSSGTHEIRYRATDSSGNYKDCVFSITVSIISCQSIQFDGNGIVSCPDGPIKGATCTLECNVGYALRGPSETVCLYDGTWSDHFEHCTDITCQELPLPDNAIMTSCDTSYRSQCTFSCVEGYELIGSESRSCEHIRGESQGYWTGNQPECEIKTCPLPSVSGGLRVVTRSTCQVRSQNIVNYGSVCEYTCETGYRMTGNHLRTCGPNGKWTQPLPVCHVITCAVDTLPIPTNGARTGCTGSSVTFGDFCSLSCNRGYRPTTPTRQTCQDNGSGQGVWSGEVTICSIVNCSPLSPPQHGNIIECHLGASSVPVTSPQPFDTSCSIKCNTGYTLTSGAASRTCLTSGQWDGQASVCTDETPPTLQCPVDITIYAGPSEITGSPTWEWEPLEASDISGSYTATLSEVDGNSVSSRPSSFDEGIHTLTYSATDSSGNIGTCFFHVTVKVVRCRPLEAPDHATIRGQGCSTTGESIIGTVCQIICDGGYERTSGDSEWTCIKDSNNPSQGSWFGTQPQCTAVQCSILTLSHGSIIGCTGNFVSYQDSCQFECDVGYRTPTGESSSTRTCQEDRTWSGQAFDCSVQVTCPTLQVPLNGTLQPPSCSSTTSPYGTVCHFNCSDGLDVSGPSRVKCLDSGSWSDTRSTSCVDLEEPVFEVNCPQRIAKTADRGQTSWTGEIEPPAATDNSGQVTVQRRRNSTSSESSTFPEGMTPVVFEAVDSSGNSAMCTVNVHVEVKRCPNMGNPTGGAVQSCSNNYGSTCRISCDTGYDLSSGSAERTCELDTNQVPYWNGSETVCTIRRCPVMVPPKHALPSNCGGTPESLATFGSVCSFYCPYGFNLRGKNTVECLASGTWSDASFVCDAITCRSLSIPGGNVIPSACEGSPPYGTQCAFECPVGFSVIPVGLTQVTCLANGEWSYDVDNVRCKDSTLPVFDRCPPTGNLIFYTSPENGTAIISWSIIATDNSNGTVTTTCKPERGSYLVSGNYLVACIARDSAGNEKPCSFDIQVKDRSCPPLPPPLHGSFLGTCSNKEGSNCTLICNDGFKIVGSSNFHCETVNGKTQWTPATVSTCTAVTCSPLNSFDEHGSITPFFCVGPSTPRAGDVCNIRCTDRYTLETNSSDAPSSIECREDGTWDFALEETFACSDLVAPDIQYCPPPVRVSRTDISRPVNVFFDLPRAVDNSNERIQPILNPSVTPPYNVSQDTTIFCLFQDSAGNQNDQCQINVAVIDDVPPVIMQPCPADIAVTASASMMDISWPEPLFSDPGGKHVIMTSNFIPGSKFAVGSYTVEYVGTNEITGQTTKCQFQIDVTSESCSTLEAPANGALACHETNEGQVCVLSCVPGYRSPPRQPISFFCDARGKWQPPGTADCGVQHRPTRSRIPMKVSYATNDCSKAVQATDVATAFLHQLLNGQFSELCSELQGCSVENIKVTCGPINSGRPRGRGKRSADLENSGNLGWSFEFDVAVDVDSSTNISDSDSVRSANSFLHSLASEVGDILPPTLSLPETVGGSVELVPNSFEIENVAAICDAGFSFDHLHSECVACVAGTFFLEEDETCHLCPVGTFQDEERQTECKICPEGTSTDREGAKGLDECYDLCPAGTYSPDGLFSCKKCEVGFYQQLAGQTFCLSCPIGQKTSAVGATSFSQCSEPCPAGSSSPNGLSPCNPCPRRYYQPDTGQRFCLICDGTKTTEGVGSTSQSQCIDLDHCFNEPCQNGGNCLNHVEGYICDCPAGFEGQDCEVNVDECRDQPCMNGGTCIDGINSFQCLCLEGLTGPDCSININECDAEPCANGGTCEDDLGTFFCHCPSTFEGHRCESEKNPCLSGPCQNGGLCHNLGQGYACSCLPGFIGKHCQDRQSPCFDKPCVNGDCVDTEEGYNCSCFSGFMGQRCDILIDFCSEMRCDNGGSCISTAKGAKCVCPPKFAGDTCDHVRTICDDGICLNGATCNPGDGHWAEYSCECVQGFNGKHCENNIDECAYMPCASGATCHDQVDGYRCECPTEYEGYYDEICQLLDTCMITPCSNGGTCHEYEDLSSECECLPGYGGDRCEVDINECSSLPCFNFGFCVDKLNGYECTCLSAYTGSHCETKLPGNSDMIFLSSEEHDMYIELVIPFEDLKVPFIKLGYWFRAIGDPEDFTLFEYISGNSSIPDLKVQNTSQPAVELFGNQCFVLRDRDLNDRKWHNLLLTINTVKSFEMAVDGVLVENKNLSLEDTFQLGGRVRIGFLRTAKVAQVVVSGVHLWSYSGMEVFSACHPVDSGDILSWEQMLFMSQGNIDVFTPSLCDDVNSCQSHPCMGNATCVDRLDTFHCICPDGFTGDICDQTIDFCYGNKCQNNASCVSTSHNFTCVCPTDFTGELCHIPVEQEDGSNPQTP